MAFCVECGAEGEVYGGLCGRCLVARNTFFEVPEALDLVECVHCHAFKVGSQWVPIDRGEAVSRILGGEVKVRKGLEGQEITIEEQPEDDRNILLTVVGRGRLGALDVSEVHPVRLRVKNGTCDVCSRRRGQYYEGILQVRADGRALRPWEVARIGSMVDDRTARREGRSEFLAKEERVAGGIDYYLSSNGLAKTLSREIQAAMGGEIKISPKLHTRREGRDLYRVTYLVRLPAYALGDVVEVEDGWYQLTTAGPTITGVALEDGRRRSFKPADLKKAKVLGSEETQAILVAQSGSEVQVMDPSSYRTETLPKPRGFEPVGESVTVLRVEGRTFIAPLRVRSGVGQKELARRGKSKVK